jgi:hypothetical protein
LLRDYITCSFLLKGFSVRLSLNIAYIYVVAKGKCQYGTCFKLVDSKEKPAVVSSKNSGLPGRVLRFCNLANLSNRLK